MAIIKRITKQGFSIQTTLESNSLKKIPMLNLDWLGYNDEGIAATKPNTLSLKFNCLGIIPELLLYPDGLHLTVAAA